MVKIMTKRGISHSFHAVFIKGHSSGHRLFAWNVSGTCVAFLESVCSSITLWCSSMPLVLILSSAMICSAGVWQKLEEQTGVEVQALKVSKSSGEEWKELMNSHTERCAELAFPASHICVPPIALPDLPQLCPFSGMLHSSGRHQESLRAQCHMYTPLMVWV